MKTVWKFPLAVADEQIVGMPANAHILCVQTQHGDPMIWALVDPSMPTEKRKILITGTGHERQDLAGLVNYIGTFQVANGQLVFHVFEDVLAAEIADATTMVEATA